jgi:hypothetical protein
VGLNLVIVGEELMVRAFNTLANGEPGPAFLSGQIEIGDILVGVNDVRVTTFAFRQLMLY